MKIIIDMKGGLGNQLFEYAFGYAISRESGGKLWLDTSNEDAGLRPQFILDNFNVSYNKRISYPIIKSTEMEKFKINKIIKKVNIGIFTKRYGGISPTTYEKDLQKIHKDTYFSGYWQSEKYFKKYEKDIKKAFEIKRNLSPKAKEIMMKIERENGIGCHIRRGDYLQRGWQLPMEYYFKGIEIIDKREQNLNIYIFSDDMDYVKEYFKDKKEVGRINFIDYESDDRTLDDFVLMSKCKHNVISNSTYSWWAAWLNENEKKIVVCPELEMWKEDFYPEEWTKIVINE